MTLTDVFSGNTMPSTFASQVSQHAVRVHVVPRAHDSPSRLALISFRFAVPTEAFRPTQFSSQIVKGFGFSAVQTTIISTCPAATIQLYTFLIFSYLASRMRNTRLWWSLVCSVPPLIGASLLHALPTSNTAGRLAGYYLTYT
jgi:hypothetical protein